MEWIQYGKQLVPVIQSWSTSSIAPLCIVHRSWIQARDERTGWKAVINLSRPGSSLLSVSPGLNEILIGGLIMLATCLTIPWHGWLTEIIGRERKRKNNRPCFITSNQYLIWKAGKVLTMQSLSISVIITNALFQPLALKPSQRRRKICRNVAAQVITIQNYSLIIMPDLLAGIYFSQT